MTPTAVEAIEGCLRLGGRLRGVGLHPYPERHFGSGGLPEAEARCAKANRDLPGFLRPVEDPPVENLQRVPIERTLGPRSETLWFDSPLPSGKPANDRVQVRLYRPADGERDDRVVIFHHPIYQRRWVPWEWFLADLISRVPVAMMAGPYHFDRCPPGEFPGEGMCNANPWRLFESFRQWSWDQRATHRLLREHCGLAPVALVGYSVGAFLSLIAGSVGAHDLPVVSIASTNRYAHGVIHGSIGHGILDAMRRVGIDEQKLWTMTESVQLERYVPELARPVLFIRGVHDSVDPPPSPERLERALRPTRAVHLDVGHSTIVFRRARVAREIRTFLRDVGAL
jgi:pimeloyl-ACP methyl ester carboxylesterase